MKYSQIRIALLTFTLGLVSTSIADFMGAKWIESSINAPETESGTLILHPMRKEEIIKAGYGVDINGGGKPIAHCRLYAKEEDITEKNKFRQ